MSDMIRLVAPCCGRDLRPAPLQFSATINVRRRCCGRRWSITIRPLAAHPHRETQMHQVDWAEIVTPNSHHDDLSDDEDPDLSLGLHALMEAP